MPHFCMLSFSDADLLGLPGYDTGAPSQVLLLERRLQRISQLICQERKAGNDQTERLDRKLQIPHLFINFFPCILDCKF